MEVMGRWPYRERATRSRVLKIVCRMVVQGRLMLRTLAVFLRSLKTPKMTSLTTGSLNFISETMATGSEC